MNENKDMLRAVGTILATSVLIDERLRDIEMVEFSHSIMTINRYIQPDVILPREDILKWFDDNAAGVSENILKDKNNVWKTEILSKIIDPELRSMVLAAMFSISVCDYELDDEECEFLRLAVSLWKVELPRFKEIERMVG